MRRSGHDPPSLKGWLARMPEAVPQNFLQQTLIECKCLQANSKPSAPRPACPSETCLLQPTSSAGSTVPHKLMQSQPLAGGVQGFTGEKIKPVFAQAGLIATA